MDCLQALSSLSVASVQSVQSVEAARSKSLASVAAEQSRSLESVASVRSKSIESEASVASVQGKPYTTPTGDPSTTTTATTDDSSNGKGNNNVAVVGGAVGGVLGAAVIGLVGLLLWRRNRGGPPSPPAGQQPFLGQQPSSQPITPASPTFSTNTSYLGGPPITYAAQAGWQTQQSIVPQGAGSPTAGQTSVASQQSASPPHTVNTWIDRPPTVYQENHGGYPSQSRASPLSAAEGPVDPRELYNDALRGSTQAAPAPSNIPSSTPGASGSAPPPAPAYPFTPSVPEKSGPWKI